MNRTFTSTATKSMESDMMARINALMEKNKAIQSQAKERQDLSVLTSKLEKFKANDLKDSNKFIERYKDYLSNEELAKVQDHALKDARVDELVKDKYTSLDLNSFADIETASRLTKITYESKYRTFNKILDIFKSSMEKRDLEGTISKPEMDVFQVLLGKRLEDRQAMLDFRNNEYLPLIEKLSPEISTPKLAENIAKLSEDFSDLGEALMNLFG